VPAPSLPSPPAPLNSPSHVTSNPPVSTDPIRPLFRVTALERFRLASANTVELDTTVTVLPEMA